MDKKIKRRWIRALRSGKYEQCKGYLHLEGDGFCCLGVLCDVLKKDLKIGWCSKDDGSCTIDGDNLLLPPDVRKLAELKEDDPIIEKLDDKIIEDIRFMQIESRIPTLSKLNDAGYTFKEIADIISKYL